MRWEAVTLVAVQAVCAPCGSGCAGLQSTWVDAGATSKLVNGSQRGVPWDARRGVSVPSACRKERLPRYSFASRHARGHHRGVKTFGIAA